MPARIAIIGSGVSGIGAAWLLSQQNEVTIYEKNNYVGGHTNTIDIPTKTGTTPVDTGFIVFNSNTYPNLINFFKTLNVKYQASDMSFAVSTDKGQFEWAGNDLSTVFAQKSNLFSWPFYQMLWDMLRFNREGSEFLLRTDAESKSMTLGQFLDKGGYSQSFRVNYLLPMSASIWSTPPGEMLNFPAITLFRFFHNHSFLQIFDRPQWQTVTNGSRNYIKVALEKVKDIRVNTPVTSIRRTPSGKVIVTDANKREEEYDQVVLACHGDQSLRLLSDPSPEEIAVLQHIKYKKNIAIVHRDKQLMPQIRHIWASWNYIAKRSGQNGHDPDVCLTYWMNKLQPFLPQTEDENVFVTLNALHEPSKESIIAKIEYEHPIYSPESIKAQAALPFIQGHRNTFYCGAWTNFGFHEDGVTSGLRVAELMGAKCPFPVVDATHIRSVSKL